MALDEADLKLVVDKIKEQVTGIGESLVKQAKDAAMKVVEDLTGQVSDLAGRVGKAVADPKAVQDTVDQAVTTALQQRDQAAADKQAQAAAKQKLLDARAAYVKDKAPKLPATYLPLVPESDKPEELKAGLDKALEQFQADMKAAGVTLPSMGGSADGKGDSNLPAAKTQAELAAMSKSDRDAYLRQVATQTTQQ